MPYITRPGEPYPWFAGTSHALDQIIGIDQQGIRDQYHQLGEQRAEGRQIAGEGRHNAEYDRREAGSRKYTEGQQAAERKRKGGADSLMLTTLQGAGLLPRTPELDAAGKTAAGGVDLDMNTLVRMYAEKVIRDKQAAEAKVLQGLTGVGMPAPGDQTVGPPTSPNETGAVGSPGVTINDPAHVLTLSAQQMQAKRDAVAAGNTAADNVRGDKSLELRGQQVDQGERRLEQGDRRLAGEEGRANQKLTIAQVDAQLGVLRQKLGQRQQDFIVAQKALADMGGPGQGNEVLEANLEHARQMWNQTNAAINDLLKQRGTASAPSGQPGATVSPAYKSKADELLGP